MDEVLASDSDLPGCDLDGRFWWDSDYSDHDPGTSGPDDELCAVCGMDRPVPRGRMPREAETIRPRRPRPRRYRHLLGK